MLRVSRLELKDIFTTTHLYQCGSVQLDSSVQLVSSVQLDSSVKS